MNKLHDLFLLTVAFVVVICISVSIRTNLDANTTPAQTNIAIDLPSDLPGDLREDGWHFYIYEGPIDDKLETSDLRSYSSYGEMSNIYAIDISRTYKMGNWKHYIKHLVPPGNRYLHVGYLYYNGREVKDARNYNDYMKTPWGNLYWVGKTRVTRYGPQGWMRTPNLRFPIGQELFPVEESDYDFTKNTNNPLLKG